MNSTIDEEEEKQIIKQAVFWMLCKEKGSLTRAEQRRYEVWRKLPHRAEALRRVEAFSNWLKQPWVRRRLAMKLVWSK